MKRQAGVVLLTLGALLFLARPVQAQFIGDRIRITTESGEKIIGEMQKYDASSLTILTGLTEQQRIAYADMAELDRSLGVRSYYREGAKSGVMAGALFSIMASAIAAEGAFVFVVYTGFLMTTGCLAGLIAGGLMRRERWNPLDIPRQPAASVTPVIGVQPGGRLALGARISF